MKNFFAGITGYWGSDAPQEVYWALNDLLDWAKLKGFKPSIEGAAFDNPISYNEPEGNDVYNINELLQTELSLFFENKI